MKKPPAAPVELHPWQFDVLTRVGRTRLSREAVFGGGAALSAVYLHHRYSEDLDFFFFREVAPADLRTLSAGLSQEGTLVTQTVLGPRRSLTLSRDEKEFGRVDFAYYPYDPIDRAVSWRGLRVDSLLDMTVNKVQAILTRFQPRDFVDLHFLLHEGPERDLERLLDYCRAKFDIGADVLALAERLLLVRESKELPRMIRRLPRQTLIRFFEDKARELVRRG